MKSTESPPAAPPGFGRTLGVFALALGAVLLALFARSFESGLILFSSDGPLGANAAAYAAMPEAYRGMWQDLNWVGGQAGSAFPSLTYLLLWVLGPLWFAKLYAPVSLAVVGFSAWLFCRQLGFRPAVGILAGLAAALNSDIFSYACWGLGTHALAVASTFLALAALVTPVPRFAWMKTVLAGAAVGLAVMEGFDSGAILSLYVAAFALFAAWIEPGPAGRRLLRGVATTAAVAVVAAWVAAQALTILVGTQVKGVVGMEQDAATKARRWVEATMWSLPKMETLRTVVPGLYGYRMYAQDGSDYWGRVGETPGVPGTRHSGAGHYAGIAVVLLAGYALAQSFRRQDGPFSAGERRAVWFWTAAAAVSLALAWGRHAPFYQFFYALPYFSTIRNPVKFLHPFSLTLLILFAYGAEALWRNQIGRVAATASGLKARLRQWSSRAAPFDRRSVTTFILLTGAGLLFWLLYASGQRSLEAHLRTVVSPPELAPKIAAFSVTEVGWSVLFLALTAGVVVLIITGLLSGKSGRLAALCLGAVLVVDLGRANLPWIVYWKFDDKYAANPVFDLLRRAPHEQRVSVIPIELNRELAFLQDLYRAEWLQHAFRYYNIQSLDVVQDPRPSVDNELFRAAFMGSSIVSYVRLWELTSTRYLLGVSGLADGLNQQVDPGQQRFRDALPFGMAQEGAGGAIRVVTNSPGPFSILEFAGALPRAGLYRQWEIATNDSSSLRRLADPAFDPRRTLILPPGTAVSAPPATDTNAPAGTVEFESYAPKRLVLKTRSEAPALLLLNDKYDPRWRVTVDGEARPLWRANFLMRAVEVPAGEHTVVFSFALSPGPLLVSLSGLGLALGLLGWVWAGRRI